eukprot:jgi/Mesen1/704/ME000109S_10925
MAPQPDKKSICAALHATALDRKVVVLFRATGDAPIFRQAKFKGAAAGGGRRSDGGTGGNAR